MALSLHTAPVGQALDLAAVKLQCRMGDLTDEDAYFAGVLIPAVADRAEASTRRALLTQTWDWVLDAFPREPFLEIPRPPLVSVTFVHYVDTAGVTQTWSASAYLVQTPAGARCARGRIALPFAGVWPVTLDQMGAVTLGGGLRRRIRHSAAPHDGDVDGCRDALRESGIRVDRAAPAGDSDALVDARHLPDVSQRPDPAARLNKGRSEWL